LPRRPAIVRFKALIQEEWKQTVALVEEARRREAARHPVAPQ